MRLALLAVILAVTGIAAAERQPEDQCGGSTYDQSVCLSDAYRQVDAALNAEYRKATENAAHRGDADTRRLKDTELKWIRYRDAHCGAEYGLWDGGTGGPIARLRCMIRLTRQRTNELHQVYNDSSN